jgi:hypothetical protein
MTANASQWQATPLSPISRGHYQLGVKTERIISDRPTDRRLTEGKNGFGRIVAGYGYGYG